MKIRRYIRTFCNSLPILPALLFTLLSSLTTANTTHADTPLDTIEAAYVEISTERVLDGVIEAVNKSTVSAQTSGRVIEINFDVNDFVAKDAVLLRLRDTRQRADYDAAKASHEEALSEYQRISELYAKKLVSKAELDKAEARQKAGRANMESAGKN